MKAIGGVEAGSRIGGLIGLQARILCCEFPGCYMMSAMAELGARFGLMVEG